MTFSPDDLRLLASPPDLPGELRRLLPQLPKGQTVSFGDLAEALGDLKAARWVAAEVQNLDPDEFPVHRVIRRTGKIVGTSRLSANDRAARLRAEGVPVIDEAVPEGCRGWCDFVGSAPLRELIAVQQRIAEGVEFPPLDRLPERLAGLDVSYSTETFGVAAYTVVTTRTGELLHHECISSEVPFPYIPGYLSFRELPLYQKLLEQVRRAGRLEPWILVDGNGILHPRRAGIATMVGGALSVRTIGVSKHLLCGKAAESSLKIAEIRAEDGGLLGYGLQRGSKRSTIYVSPGSGVDAPGALRIVESVLGGRRLPEPLYQADRLSRILARQHSARGGGQGP